MDTSALSSISLTSWAGIAAGAALVGGLWRNVVTWLGYLSNMVVAKVALREEAARAMQSYIWTRGIRSPFTTRIFGGWRTFVGPRKRIETVGYETMGQQPMLYWFGRTPVLAWLGGSMAGTNSTYGTSGSDLPISVCYLRGTLNFDAILEEALVAYNQLAATATSTTQKEARPKRFAIHRVSRGSNTEGAMARLGSIGKEAQPSGSSGQSTPADFLKQLQLKELRLVTWTPDDLVERVSDKPPFDLYPYEPHQMAIIPELETWLTHKLWFESRGIPHRRGMLLTGQPGTGKSTFVRSVAIKLDLPIYVFDLATLDNRAFADEWRSAQANAPAIILLEDLDCTFKGRENVAPASKNRDPLTMDCVLNTISGVGSSDGILLFVTTNHVESLDPALGVPTTTLEGGSGISTRPGRLDRVIHFGTMQEPQRRKLASFILEEWPESVDTVVAEGEGQTCAQFQYKCSQFAERMFWERGVSREALEGAKPVVVHPVIEEKGSVMINFSPKFIG